MPAAPSTSSRFDALITAPVRGCIGHMKAHRRADGAPLLHL